MKVRPLAWQGTNMDVDQDLMVVEDPMIPIMVVKMVQVDLEIMLVSLHINKGILFKNTFES